MAYLQCFTKNSQVRVTAAYPNYPSGGYHGALDLQMIGSPAIYAPAGGKVVKTYRWQGGTSGTDSWGNHIVVQIEPYAYYLVAHMAGIEVALNSTVSTGDYIGQQGETGNVTGPHVHWEYWAGGYGTSYRANPAPLLGIPNAVGVYDVEWAGEGGGNIPDPESGVTFSPPPGTLLFPEDIEITTNQTGEIYYTVDGVYPDINDTQWTHKYTGPVHIGQGDTQFIVGVYNPATGFGPWGFARYRVIFNEWQKRKKLKKGFLYYKVWPF